MSIAERPTIPLPRIILLLRSEHYSSLNRPWLIRCLGEHIQSGSHEARDVLIGLLQGDNTEDRLCAELYLLKLREEGVLSQQTWSVFAKYLNPSPKPRDATE